MSIVDGLITIKEAAERSGYREQTLRNKARNGEIAHVRRGWKYFFRPEVIDNLVTEVPAQNDPINGF